MADGFLGRWSQRKQAVRAGQPLVDPVIKPNMPVAPATPTQAATVSISNVPLEEVIAPEPAPTLDDVQALKPDDSFARFVARDVSPDVRNAAMKKLFADPHYNVMDGLDIYIDDYSIASPLPEATLRQMASAKFLNLFEEDPPIGEDAHTASAPSVAQSATAPDSLDTLNASTTEPLTLLPLAVDSPFKDTPHDHIDLRLQPDHAAGPAALERQPERALGAAQQPVPSPSR